MSHGPLNLARTPFVNARPVSRATVLLWMLGAGLLLANVMLFWGYVRATQGRQTQLASLRDSAANEERLVTGLQVELERSKLAQLNQQVAFLNRRIAERTFGWGLLFDRIAEVLPREVRLHSLAPVNIVPTREPSGRPSARPADPRTGDRFTLSITGAAQSDEALMRFVDALFSHPNFTEPDLKSESHRPGEPLNFDLAVTYLPRASAAARDTASPASAKSAPPEAAEGASKPVSKPLSKQARPIPKARARAGGGGVPAPAHSDPGGGER